MWSLHNSLNGTCLYVLYFYSLFHILLVILTFWIHGLYIQMYVFACVQYIAHCKKAFIDHWLSHGSWRKRFSCYAGMKNNKTCDPIGNPHVLSHTQNCNCVCCMRVWNLVSHPKGTTHIESVTWHSTGETEENSAVRSFIICTINQILLGRSNQEGWDEWDN
jgi:hypothetical protein